MGLWLTSWSCTCVAILYSGREKFASFSMFVCKVHVCVYPQLLVSVQGLAKQRLCMSTYDGQCVYAWVYHIHVVLFSRHQIFTDWLRLQFSWTNCELHLATPLVAAACWA